MPRTAAIKSATQADDKITATETTSAHGHEMTMIAETGREAFEAVTLPDLADQWGTTSAEAVERALLDANPALARDQLTVTCDDGHIQEVRLCLDLDLTPRRCGDDVIRDCRLEDAVLPAP